MTIERALQLIKGNFSLRAKKELGFQWEIWQRGFSDVRITDRESYEQHVEYIYQNPVKAGYASSAEEYRTAPLISATGNSRRNPDDPRWSRLKPRPTQRLKPDKQRIWTARLEVVP